MLRIGICDDQVTARDALRFQLEKILVTKTEEIVYEFGSGDSAVKWLRSHPGEIDLLFLDMEMDGLSGLETAAEIRSFNQELLIVFATSYTDYVFDGYQVNALDYLIKPMDLTRLQRVIDRIRDLLVKKHISYFTFKNADGSYRIPYSEICYFYSEKRKVYLVTAQKEYDFYAQLNNLADSLDNDFVRIHQRYLVNPVYVSKISNALVTVGEKELPLSRAHRESATRALAISLFEGGF